MPEHTASTVLVTGATSGIGRALVERLLSDVDRVIGTARTPEKAAELAGTDDTGRLEVLVVDLTSTDSIRRFLGDVASAGTIDVLVANAGVHVPRREELTDGGVELHEQVNVRANAAIATALALGNPEMRIVHLGSNAFRIARSDIRLGTSFWWRYAVSKLRATVFFAALDRCRPGARVVTVSPGSVLTDVHRHKPGAIRSLNERRHIYISAQEAAAEIVPIVLDPAPAAFYYDRGRPTSETFFAEVDEMLDDVWGPVADLLADVGIDAELSLDHAGLVGRLGTPERTPATVEELAAVVGDGSVTVRGSRHSYNDCFVGERGVSVDRFDTPAVVDPDRLVATVGAGRTVFDLVDDLHVAGYTLRHSGNWGAQTVAGAASTGTHGYWRGGGVFSEHISAVDLVGADGEHRRIDDGDELAAARLGLGLLGVITSLELQVVPMGEPVRYRIERMPRQRFLETVTARAHQHEHLRFFQPHRESEHIAVLTIDPAPGADPTKPDFIEGEVALAGRLLSTLRRAAHGRPGAWLADRAPIDVDLTVGFSADLFVRAGIAGKAPGLSRLVYTVLNDDRTWNMEVAVPVDRVQAFLGDLDGARAEVTDPGFRSYWTARFCGANDATLLAPNRDRDVVFVDVHVTRQSPGAEDFLRRLQDVAIAAHGATLHWGKVLFGGPDELLANHDPAAVRRFLDVRAAMDPDGRFIGPFARRHLGLDR